MIGDPTELQSMVLSIRKDIIISSESTVRSFPPSNYYARYKICCKWYKIEVSDYVKILGVTFDNRMILQKHITNICRSVNMHIRKINSIRRYLSNTAVRTLVQSIVIARLDYCNSVCVGLPMNRLQRLQLVHNSAACAISQTRRYALLTHILNELHWLPINKRCQFKILLLTFKSLNGCAPEYLCDMLNVYMPNRSIRSTALHHLCHIEIDPYD